MEREEVNKTGIYLLTGNDPESGNPALYIGEAERIRDRLKYHLEKDFWNNLVFFISKDENLTKAHIRYLEGKLIEKAKLNNRIIVKNDQSSGAKLPESDREDMEVFLEKIHQLLPVLGIDLLVTTTDKKKSEDKKEVLFCEIKGLKAIGQRTPDGFVVFKDSQAVLTERSSAKNYPWPMNMRKRLKEEGILLKKDDHLIFAKDEEFSSPSAAAAVIHGGHANGLIAWKDKAGKALKEKEVF